jgi:hypothetical protein
VTRQSSLTGRTYSPNQRFPTRRNNGNLTQLWRESVRTKCQVGSLLYSALCLAIVESSLLTIRTLVAERAASRGHGAIAAIALGMDDGSGIGIGTKPSSWVLNFMSDYYLDYVCGSEASNSPWHLRCCSDWTGDILLEPSLHGPIDIYLIKGCSGPNLFERGLSWPMENTSFKSYNPS